ncbi:hypothetical protein [Verrucomicrobium spinosum]|uniref:hypothetical protein n=1 Tax=Verrucomicrobium spinosum TaxID=2736 RepID=UPI0001745BF1|nr:hypothetical protein [Verrucomicrobium spinosum]
MSASRKPRGDAKLKTLPEELQEEIWERLGKGTHAAVRKWLQQEMDIATSLGALSEFYSWYGLRRDLQEADSEVTSLMQLIKEGEYSLDTQQLESLGNTLFLLKARSSGDWKQHKAAVELLLKSRKVAVEERKVAILEQKAAQADKAKELLGDKALTPEERDRKMKAVFGISS